jgi:hypothetical protein
VVDAADRAVVVCSPFGFRLAPDPASHRFLCEHRVKKEAPMNIKKCLIIGIVVGIVAAVFDLIVHGGLLASYYAQAPFRQDTSLAWMLVSNVVAGLVFAWVYLKVAGSFAPGVSGGVTMGFYAGVLVNFPSAIVQNLVLQNFPYALSWLWVVSGVVFYVIAGAIAGALNKK